MLTVSDLSVSIGTRTDFTDIVSSVSFEIGKGEILGLVGESGCGKSMTSLAVMGLLPEGGPWVRTGRAELAGFDVIHSPPYRRVETGHGCIAMIFQEPMSSLNPVMKIGEQIEEAIRVHERLSGDALDADRSVLHVAAVFPQCALYRDRLHSSSAHRAPGAVV